jgi:glutathione S-transferase
MPIDPNAALEITAFSWVPRFAQGFVRDLRPRWACEEVGLPYRERLVSAMQRPEWFYGEQPWGQVPVLHDGEVRLFESGAILLHLGEKDERLLPRPAQPRADAISWLFAAFNSVEPFVFELGNVDMFSRNEEWAKLRRPSLIDQLGGRLDRLETALGDREWLAGPFSIADIAMATVLREVERAGLLEERPALAAYLSRALARPAFRTALADQLARFAENAPKQTEGA